MNAQGLLTKIEDILDQGSKIPLSGKVAVDAEQIKKCIEDIRYDLPTEIQKAQEIISQRKQLKADAERIAEAIVQEANLKAETIAENARTEAESVTEAATRNAQAKIASASEEARLMVEQSEITRAAHEYSDRIREKAAREAENTIRDARNQADAILNEATAKAGEIKKKSEQWSAEIRQAATDYVKDIVKNSDNVLSSNVAELRKMSKNLFGE